MYNRTETFIKLKDGTLHALWSFELEHDYVYAIPSDQLDPSGGYDNESFTTNKISVSDIEHYLTLDKFHELREAADQLTSCETTTKKHKKKKVEYASLAGVAGDTGLPYVPTIKGPNSNMQYYMVFKNPIDSDSNILSNNLMLDNLTKAITKRLTFDQNSPLVLSTVELITASILNGHGVMTISGERMIVEFDSTIVRSTDKGLSHTKQESQVLIPNYIIKTSERYNNIISFTQYINGLAKHINVIFYMNSSFDKIYYVEWAISGYDAPHASTIIATSETLSPNGNSPINHATFYTKEEFDKTDIVNQYQDWCA